MRGFYAFPSLPTLIGQTIQTALAGLNPAVCQITTWQENDIAGYPLVSPILASIDQSDFLAADISSLNFNVTFEIGYAIAKNKRVFLTRNSSLKKDALTDIVGIFDTLGYETYNNSDALVKLLRTINKIEPLPINYPADRRAPVYVVEPPRRDELTLTLISKLKKSRLKYKSYNPSEDTRLSATDAIKKVVGSFGVVVPLLSKEMEDSDLHNIRAAFVAGLAFGSGLPFLAAQHLGGPVPLDIRDFAKTIKHPDELRDAVQEFAIEVTERLQTFELEIQPEAGALTSISFGDPMAENEFETIDSYFLNTDQYLKAERGEIHLVVGRKGTGKTAIFGHLRNRKRADRINIVLDLKPEGYQLVKLREKILTKLNQGAKQHLIVAFWEYILYLEFCNKLLEKDRQRHLTDNRLFEPYNRLKAKYGEYSKFNEADFSERLLAISDHIIAEYQRVFGDRSQVDLFNDDITNLVYKIDLKLLREDVGEYLKFKKQSFVLFDNLDRGWPETGLTPDDVLVMRCLIDASRKIQREMRQKNLDFSCIVFLRNDVYQLLMRTTSDFGKDLKAQLDWTDADQIREMIRLRMIQNEKDRTISFDTIWRSVCVSHVDGEESSQYLIDRSLYRPRNVLKLIYHCRAAALNLNKSKIEEEDFKKGVATFSTDLIVEASRELADVMPIAAKKIYAFVEEENPTFTFEELEILMSESTWQPTQFEKLVHHMLYFSILGLERDGEVKYIYDVGYDMDILRAEIKKFSGVIRYHVHPAFWPALRVGAAR
jgi:hypothetical protein